MSESIAKYFRSVDIAILDGMIEKRRKGIDNFFSQKYDNDDILNLVKLFFRKECAEVFLKKFVENFAKVDDVFDDDQKKEICVLAGIILSKMCKQESTEDIFVMTVYAKSYVFLGNKPILEDIYCQIEEACEKEAAKIREELILEPKTVKALSKEVSFSMGEDEAYEVTNEDVGKFSQMAKKINEICVFINKEYCDLTKKNKILYENTEILWWLLAGYSIDMEVAYAGLPLHQAAILVGKDLAEIVQNKPGLYSVRNLLHKVLEQNRDKKSSFAGYIDACDDSIIAKMTGGVERNIQTPVLYALYKKSENGKGNWNQTFEKKFGKVDAEYSGLEFAYQTYLECLMLKWTS